MDTTQAEYIMENARIFYDTGYEAMESFYKLKGGDNSNTHRSHITVAATNIHFAVELALKALSGFTIPNFDPQKASHNLSGLFDGLSDQRKRDITREYDEKLYLSKTFEPHVLTKMKQDRMKKHLDKYKSDLTNMLKQHKDGFVSWRYNSYGIKEPILFFDYHALAIPFKVLQTQVWFIILLPTLRATELFF